MTYLAKLRRDLFGDGMPIQQREPEPATMSEKLMAYAGAVFLIAVATYIPLSAFRDYKYLEDRKTAVLERCVVETNSFVWCWKHLTR